jgi:hypothetical protein
MTGNNDDDAWEALTLWKELAREGFTLSVTCDTLWVEPGHRLTEYWRLQNTRWKWQLIDLVITGRVPADRLTFADLARLQPFLYRLQDEARGYHEVRRRCFCANEVWYRPRGLKDRLAGVVGPNSGRTGILGTEEAEDVAGETRYHTLPDCRNCGCL